MKYSKQQIEAIKIYKRTYKISKEAIEKLKKQGIFEKIEKSYRDCFEKAELDKETARDLRTPIQNPYDVSSKKSIIESVKIALKEVMRESKAKEDNKDNLLYLTLSADGDLYREPKNKYCYSMKKEGKRLEILKILDHNFTKTTIITEQTTSKNNESIRKAIGEINRKAISNLKLERPLIESKTDSGYRINEFYELNKQ